MSLNSDDNVIAIHAIIATLGVLFGVVALIGRRARRLHGFSGGASAVMLATAAVLSFWIHELRGAGRFSGIHALSVIVLLALSYSQIALWRGNARGHGHAMLGVLIGAMIAGMFTLWPTRRIGAWLFGEP